MEFAHEIGIEGKKVGRRIHVNLFVKKIVQESIININLLKRPLIGDSKSKNEANRDRFDNGRETFSIITTILLMKTFCYQACFILIDSSISIFFNTKDPFTSNRLATRWKRGESPRVISH